MTVKEQARMTAIWQCNHSETDNSRTDRIFNVKTRICRTMVITMRQEISKYKGHQELNQEVTQSLIKLIDSKVNLN